MCGDGGDSPNGRDDSRIREITRWMDEIPLTPEECARLPGMNAAELHKLLAKRASQK